VLETDLEAQPYGTRLETLFRRRRRPVGRRRHSPPPGSLDSAIRNAAANDLSALIVTLPHVRAVAFNGAKSHALGSRLLAGTGLPLIQLPSSSPANASIPLETKLERWRALRAFL
jgi:double-stranded uracil-DNA glycosylase